MATLEERFQQGMGIRAKFGGGTPVESTVPDSRDLAPDLHRIAGEALFGSIWTRPALGLEHREMITLSVFSHNGWNQAKICQFTDVTERVANRREKNDTRLVLVSAS